MIRDKIAEIIENRRDDASVTSREIAVEIVAELAEVRAAGERLADCICNASETHEDDVILALKNWGRVSANGREKL